MVVVEEQEGLDELALERYRIVGVRGEQVDASKKELSESGGDRIEGEFRTRPLGGGGLSAGLSG
jgi:hypothetical protein